MWMQILKKFTLAMCAVAVVGFGACGTLAVVMEFPMVLRGCNGGCFGWTFGLVSLGVAFVLGLLARALYHSINQDETAGGDSPQ